MAADVKGLDRNIALSRAWLAGVIAAPTRLDVARMATVDQDDGEIFASPRRPAPAPQSTDGAGHSPELVGLGAALPRDKRGPAVKRTAGCVSLHRQRGTTRASFSGC